MGRFGKKQKRGFTLIEVLLYMAVSSVIIFTLASVLYILTPAQAKNRTVIEVEEQGLFVTQEIIKRIREAEGVTAPSAGVSAATLTLDTASTSTDPVVFTLSSGVLQLEEAGGGAVSLTNDRVTVSGLSFSNLSKADTPGVVSFEFTLTHINPELRNEFDYEQIFRGSASLRENN
jgi:prepilin-type N-terminal cleavage/methylation domain-containing protein